MEARAYLKYARIAPRKVQIVLDLIRNQADKIGFGYSEAHSKGRLRAGREASEIRNRQRREQSQHGRQQPVRR